MDIALATGLLFILLILEMPIAFSLFTAGAFGLWLTSGFDVMLSYLGDVIYEETSSYILLTVPMFILMSQFLAKSGLAKDIVIACDLWLSKIRGGLGIACVASSAMMAAIIGSSTASTATMSTAAFPTMREVGYSPRFSVGIIAISGTLAIMIPPSIILIIYGILTEEPIGKLLIAGIIPGLITAVGYISTIIFMSYRNPELIGKPVPFEFDKARKSLIPVWPTLVLMGIILFCLYTGVATPTEVGAIGASVALLIVFGLKRLTGVNFKASISETVKTSVMIISIICGAMMFGYFLTMTGATQSLVDSISKSGLDRWQVMLILVFIYLILGMLMDQMAVLVLTVPITYAIVSSLGFDGIWYGIIITKTVEIGLVTPPLGLNVYIASSITGVPTGECFKGVAPFVLVELVVLSVLIFIPELSTWLPSLMSIR